MTPSETNVTLVSLAEVKNIMKKLSKERKELLYEQRIALEHAQKFSKLPLKKMQELVKDLKKLEIIDDLYAYKIADLLPTSADDVKAIFAKSRITLNENNIKNILEIVNKYFVE